MNLYFQFIGDDLYAIAADGDIVSDLSVQQRALKTKLPTKVADLVLALLKPIQTFFPIGNVLFGPMIPGDSIIHLFKIDSNNVEIKQNITEYTLIRHDCNSSRAIAAIISDKNDKHELLRHVHPDFYIHANNIYPTYQITEKRIEC